MSTIANGRGCPRSSCPSGWVSPANRFPSGSGMNPCQRRTSCRCLPKHWACLWTRCCPGRRRPRPSPPGPRLPKAGLWGSLPGCSGAGAGWAAWCWPPTAPSPLGWACWLASSWGRCSRLWSCCCKPAGRCARPLWGSKSSPWPSWWWAGWPLLGESSRRSPLPQAAQGEAVRLFC